MGSGQYYHRRRRRRERKQAQQARREEENAAAAATVATASDTDTTPMSDSANSARTCVHTDSSPSNHIQSQHHRRVSNNHHQHDTHENKAMSKRAGVKSSSTKTANSVIESINPSTVVHCAGQELHFIRSRNELSSGQKCFTMTSTQQLIPCTILSSTTHECKKGKKTIKYEIILDKRGAIQNDVNHSRLWILHHKPTPTLSHANTKQSSSTTMSTDMFMNTLCRHRKVKQSGSMTVNNAKTNSPQRGL